MALPPAPAGARLTPRVRVAIASVLALVVAVCVALLVWLSVSDRASADGGLNLPDEREQAMSLTDQFAKRLAYSPDLLDESGQMPEYRARMTEILSPKFATEFEDQVAAAEQIVAQARVTREVDVFATAVSSIDDDSGRVLVAGAFIDSYAQGEGEDAETVKQEPFPFRLVVDVVKIDGEWVVDDFSPVSDADDEALPEAPSQGDPTEGGTP